MGIVEAVLPQHKKVLKSVRNVLWHIPQTIPSRIIMFIDNQDHLKMVLSSSVSSCMNVDELDRYVFSVPTFC